MHESLYIQFSAEVDVYLYMYIHRGISNFGAFIMYGNEIFVNLFHKDHAESDFQVC